MKRIMLVLLVVLLAACQSKFKPRLSSSDGVKFEIMSVDSAKAVAKASDKPLFIFAHASWCATCKKMENEVLVEKEIGKIYNANFINVAIDVDSGNGKELNKLYTVKATPTLLFFKADGTIIKKWEGLADTARLFTLAREVE